MKEIEVFWYTLIVLCTIYSLVNWRRGIYLGIAIDFLRDPIRKLSPNQPVYITLSGAAFWGMLVLSILLTQPRMINQMTGAYPRLRIASRLVFLAVIPAATMSFISYSGGLKLAIIGGASYIFPLLGIAAGYGMVNSEKQVFSILRWYIFVNGLALISVPLEYWKVITTAVGGINYHWIRYSATDTIDLMSGWYRSPDIMGLHAAHVIMFAMLLAVRSRTETQLSWLAMALWAAFCVLLSGRRKMIGIPMVFLATYVLLGTSQRVGRITRLLGFFCGAVVCAIAIIFILWDVDEYVEYTDFAGTLFTHGIDRGSELMVGHTYGTIQSTSIFGAGLGTGTQGMYHFSASGERPRTWQEDGISRLFLEFGVPGVIILICAAYQMLRVFRRALKNVLPGSREQLVQLALLSVVAGDAASYAISHQQFSGDPVNGLFVTLIAGMALALTKQTNIRPVPLS